MKARRALKAHGPSGDAAVAQYLTVQAHQRLCQLVQVAGAGEPVVHLRVDIHSVVAKPRRELLPVPKALEICRLGPGAGAGYQQIAAKVEQQRRQIGVRLSVFRIPYAPIRVSFPVTALSQVQRYPVKIAPVLAYMSFQQDVKVFFKGRHVPLNQAGLIRALGEWVAVEPGEAASDTEEQGDPGGVLNEKALLSW